MVGGRYWSVGRLHEGVDLGRDERPAVDGEVHRPAQLDVVPKQGTARVEDEHVRLERGEHEELRLVDAVASDELALVASEPRSRRRVLDLPAGHVVNEGCGIGSEIDVDPVHVVGARPPIGAVALEEDALPRNELRDVVGRGARQRRLRALWICWQVRGNRTELARSRGEVGHRLRQPEDERPSLRLGSRERGRLAGEHLLGSDEVLEITGVSRPHVRVENALERVREVASRHR
jgi:hypothetical protein